MANNNFVEFKIMEWITLSINIFENIDLNS